MVEFSIFVVIKHVTFLKNTKKKTEFAVVIFSFISRNRKYRVFTSDNEADGVKNATHNTFET
jgi:hypothetical protein